MVINTKDREYYKLSNGEMRAATDPAVECTSHDSRARLDGVGVVASASTGRACAIGV